MFRVSVSMVSSYDAVVIGGGHNGLVAAAYLAKSGKSVCVVERRGVLGGAAVTEEIVPGKLGDVLDSSHTFHDGSRKSLLKSITEHELIDLVWEWVAGV